MTVTIGRASALDVRTVVVDGDRLALSGHVINSSAETVLARIGQINNLVAGVVVPVIDTTNPHHDGFYVVRQAAANYRRPMKSTGEWSVILERVANGFAAPACEVTSVAADRSTTSHAVTSIERRSYLPGAFLWQALGNVSSSNRTADSGLVVSDTAATPALRSFQFAVSPANYFNGSCRIEYQTDTGSLWHALVGRQLPRSTTSPARVRITNGLVRLTWSTTGDLSLEAFNGATWGAVGTFVLKSDATNTISPRAVPEITRNDVEACTLRFPTQYSAAINNFTRFVDFGARRGALHFEGRWNKLGGYWSIESTTTVACTALTGGIHQTTNGGTGHRWVLASPNPWTSDLVNGRIQRTSSTAATDVDFGIAVNLGGSGGASYNEPVDVLREYWAAMAEKQRVVAL
jgi:hypothetical protein